MTRIRGLHPEPLKVSEAELQGYGTDLLRLDNWRPFKMEPISRRDWGKGTGEVGMCDSLFLRYRGVLQTAASLSWAQVLWIEWKRRGVKAKPHQIAWIEQERARGALIWLADVDFPATPEGFYYHYAQSGLMVRQIAPQSLA